MPLFVLGLVALAGFLVSLNGERDDLVGSGSTLAQPLIEQSARAYRNSRTADNPERPSQTGGDWVLDGSGVSYDPVGSLGGIVSLDRPEVDFAVADYPLSAAGLDETGVVQFPVAVGAVAVVHNLDLARGTALRLDAGTLAAIYLGEIRRWDDPAIAALNDGLVLPALPINPVHRSDGSGSTLGLTRYLGAGAAAWASGPGTGALLEWPAGAAAERSSGMIAAVSGTPGSIGYVESGQAARAGLSRVALGNAAGEFVSPTTSSMRAAMTNLDFSGKDRFVEALAPSDEPAAYPAIVAIYALVKRGDEDETTRAMDYLTFIVEEFDGDAQDLGYLALPDAAGESLADFWAAQFEYRVP